MPQPPTWITQIHDEAAREIQPSNIVALATESSRQVVNILAQIQSPVVSAIANINPMLPVLSSIQESMQNWMNPIRQMAESITKIYSAFNSISAVVKAYREMMERMRAQFQYFVKSINLGLLEVAQKVVEIIFVPFYLYRYHVLKRARDGNRDATLLISQMLPLEYGRFCRLQRYRKVDSSAKLEFASYVIEAMGKGLDLSQNEGLFDHLIVFFAKLFYALRGKLRKMAHEFQQALSNDKTPAECTIECDGVRYLLLPSLSIFTNIPESTLRRCAAQGKIPAIKLRYRSPKTGNTNPAWHVEYSPTLVHDLQLLVKSGQEKITLERCSRKQITRCLGIHLDTLRLWERKGFVTPEHVNGRVWYLPEHLLVLKQIIDSNPRLQSVALPALSFS